MRSLVSVRLLLPLRRVQKLNATDFMNIKIMLFPLGLLEREERGEANGYVGLPPEHPWHGKSYDELNTVVDIHGGLTWSNNYLPANEKDPDGLWWIGFDTAHYQDNAKVWPWSRCLKETKRLRDQAYNAALQLSTGASPVKPDGSAGLSESRVTQTDPEKQLGLHDSIPAKPENTKT